MYSNVQFHMDRMHDMGYSMADVIMGTGLEARDLKNPWPMFRPEHYIALIRNMYRLTNDPMLAITINQGFSVRYMGLPGFAVLASKTFGEARKLMMRYRPLMDAAVFPTHQFSDGRWMLTLHELFNLEGEFKRFAFEGYMIKSQKFCQEITRRDDFVTRVDFNFPEPPHAHCYSEFFQCEIRFDQAECRFFYKPALLEYPLPLANQEMHELCVQQCEQRYKELSQLESLAHKVYQVLYRNHSLSKQSLLSLDEVASRQYISPRTLRRRLSCENTSFQQIANDCRRDLALYYLKETGLSTKEISFSLGYSAVNNFYRAFRDWTGKNISDIRKVQIQ